MTETKHHRVLGTDPLLHRRSQAADAPVSLGGLHLVEKIRAVAIECIAINEECSREEAARRLDATPPVSATEGPEAIAARRAESEAARITKAVSDLRMSVRPELVPDLVAGKCLRTQATTEAAAWMRSDRRVLALVGDVGVGKTVAACLVACAYVRRRKTVAYLREPQLVRWSHSSTLAHEAQVERLRDVDLLIIDEIGTTLSRDGERTRDAMFGMIDSRIGGEGRTVIIGNLTEKQLAESYGVRFLDRLREIGMVVHATGESLRGRAR